MSYCVTGVSYITSSSGTEAVLCTRDEKGRRKIFRSSYLPYFYYPVQKEKLFRKLLEVKSELSNYIVKEERYFYSTNGQQLVKVYVKNPYQVGEFSRSAKKYRDSIGWLDLYEANVLYAYRFLTDKKIYTGVDQNLNPVETESRHRLLFLDIETYGEDFSEENRYENPVIVIGLHDSYTRKYFQLYIGRRREFETEVETSILNFSSEVSLLEGFRKLYLELSPDVIVSFTNFDVRYLVERLKRNSISPSFLSPVGIVNGYRIACVDVLDYAEVYRKVFLKEPLWNTLDYIAKKELGYGKIDIGDKISNVWKKDKTLILQYNLRDVKLLVDLEEKLKAIENFIIPIWKITGLKFSDCLSSWKIGDILYLRRGHETRRVWKSVSGMRYDSYTGALVTAKPGIYENVAVFDWSELYPSIMETFHISWDTMSFVEGKDTIKIGNRYFNTLEPGESVILMKPFREERSKIKKLLKDITDPGEKQRLKMLSEAYKSVINSIYGLYGFPGPEGFGSRVYDPNVASAITFMGREIFKQVLDYASKSGLEVVYGDTDSIFVLLKDHEVSDAEEIARQINSYIARYIEETYRVPSKLKLSLDKIFRRVYIATKKRYAGLTTSNEIVVKGLEIVRKNTAPITVETEHEAIKMILEGRPIDEIVKYRDQMYEKVLNGNVEIEKIAIRSKCGRRDYDTLTSNLKAILIAQKYDIKVPMTERFYKLYLVPDRLIHLTYKSISKTVPRNVIGLSDINLLPRGLQIDFKKMAEVTILKPLNNLLEPLLPKENKVFKYRTLDSFF